MLKSVYRITRAAIRRSGPFFGFALFLCALLQMNASALWGQSDAGDIREQERGRPPIQNFGPDDYEAGMVNFAVLRDVRGLLYVGNNDGLLEYDAASWRLYPLPDNTPVFSLSQTDDGTVYFGSYGAFGRLGSDEDGRGYIELLSERLRARDATFTSVYDTWAVGNTVWFRCAEALFFWDGEQLTTVRPETEFRQSHLVGDLLYVLVDSVGLCIAQQGRISPAPGGSRLGGDRDYIAFMLPLDDGRMLVSSRKQGMLYYDGRSFAPAWSGVPRSQLPRQISCGVRLADGTIAVGSRQQGVWIYDVDGRLRHIFDVAMGLQDDYVVHLHQDEEQLLHVALDYGLARISWPCDVTTFDANTNMKGRATALTRFRDVLYVATTQGVLRLKEGNPAAPLAAERQARFQFMPGSRYDCHDLLNCGDVMLVATGSGILIHDGRTLQVMEESLGMSARVLHPLRGSQDSVLVGTSNGLFLLHRERNLWVLDAILTDIRTVVQSITSTEDGSIWIGTVGNGILLFPPNSSLHPEAGRYYPAPGSNDATPIVVSCIGNEARFRTNDGLFVFDENTQTFLPDSLPWKELAVPADLYVHAMREVGDGIIWLDLFGDRPLHGLSYRGKGDTPGMIILPFLDRQRGMSSAADMNGVLWFGTETAVYRYEGGGIARPVPAYATMIRNIQRGDTMMYPTARPSGDAAGIVLPYASGSLRIRYVLPVFRYGGQVEYRWMMEGLDDAWSDWSTAAIQDFRALPEGVYVFTVQARDAQGTLYDAASMHLRVTPPWQRSWWAWVLYVCGGIGLFMLALRMRTRRLAARGRELEQTVRERTEELRNQATKIQSQARELETLDGIVRTVNKEVQLTSLLTALLRQMLLMFPHVDAAFYLQRNAEDGLLHLASAVGTPLPALGQRAFNLSGLLGHNGDTIQTIQDGVYVLRGLETELADHENRAGAELHRAFMGLSDMQHGALRGFLVLSTEQRNMFSADDLRRLLRLREHVASAVAKAVAIRELESKNAELDESNRQLRETQQQLIVHEKLAALGELTAGIAHEIQNPLNFVNNFSSLSLELLDEFEVELRDVLEAGDANKELLDYVATVRGNCERIREHGMRATSIVRAMLMHTRKGSSRHESIVFNEFIDQFVLLSYHGMRMLYPEEDLGLHTEYDRSLTTVNLSAQELSRVIVNICNNAWEAAIEKAVQHPAGEKPEVRVATFNTGTGIRVTIRDNGAGMDQETKARIFEPFFTTKRSGSNAGLGLSLSYEIITRLHKGKLHVVSEPGAYTEFIIELPK